MEGMATPSSMQSSVLATFPSTRTPPKERR